MEYVFWLTIFLLIYPYAIYPLIILALGTIWPKSVSRREWEPTVSVLIPAYNEVDCIGATVQNKLDQNYPKEKLQIIVISDGSNDGTDDVVSGFAEQGVQLLRREGREGKAAALNAAVLQAVGKIIVFSDANSLFEKNALRNLVSNFSDHEVGYVTGALNYLTEGTNLSGMGAGSYIRYENFLRQLETKFGSVIGVNGGADAIRRELYVDTPNHLITDFVLPLSVMARGHRVIFDPCASSCEIANSQTLSEFRMRVRVALRALQGLAYMRRLLNPFNYPIASFCIFSHKILRYMAFVFLLIALICNAMLAMNSVLYQAILLAHVAVYGIALIGLINRAPSWMRRVTVVPSYLVMSYAAFAVATFKFLRGDAMATWRPRAG
ncbi:MAG: glycosyltransferase family 2 protein [Betaproteobacteria bacterium]